MRLVHVRVERGRYWLEQKENKVALQYASGSGGPGGQVRQEPLPRPIGEW